MSADKHNALACWIALQRVPGLGPATLIRLLEQFDSPQQIIDNPSLVQGLNASVVDGLRHPDWQQVEADLAWLEVDNRYLLTIDDQRYPALLREISDPPPLLYVQGDVSLLSQWQLAIVGSRNPSASGRQTAFDFSRYLASGGLTITSGLAAGIDGAAHQGALAHAQGPVAGAGDFGGIGGQCHLPCLRDSVAQLAASASSGAMVCSVVCGAGCRALWSIGRS